MLKIDVLGGPAQDNALLVTAESGRGQTRVLLDCGAQVLDRLSLSDLLSIDHLLFSHLHLDHIAGFDGFFRANFNRPGENHLWGPPETARILGHRFQGYWWNYASELSAHWLVHEVHEQEVHSWRFEAREAFALAHPAGTVSRAKVIVQTPELGIEALDLQHRGRCLGFVLREPHRSNVDQAALAALGLPGGPWLKALKAGEGGLVQIGGQSFDLTELREQLLTVTPGQSAAYLTDFLLDPAELARLAPHLQGVQTLYAEAQYAPADAELAARYHHTTVTQVAELAKGAGVDQLVLLHLSQRYPAQQRPEMLAAAQALFPDTSFPDHWG